MSSLELSGLSSILKAAQAGNLTIPGKVNLSILKALNLVDVDAFKAFAQQNGADALELIASIGQILNFQKLNPDQVEFLPDLGKLELLKALNDVTGLKEALALLGKGGSHVVPNIVIGLAALLDHGVPEGLDWSWLEEELNDASRFSSVKSSLKAKHQVKVASLFCGCGGMDLGFKWAGYQLVYSNELDPSAARSYRRNIHHRIDNRPIQDVDIGRIPKHHILIGGFPCQPFSHAGKRGARPDFTPVVTPVYPSVGYLYDDMGDLDAIFGGTRFKKAITRTMNSMKCI